MNKNKAHALRGGQGAIEYLLILGAAILVVAIVMIAMVGVVGTGKDQNASGNYSSGVDQIQGLTRTNNTLKVGLVGYWPLDETNGTIAYDYSGLGHNGSLGNGVVANQPLVNQTGKVGKAFTFDGINDFINISGIVFSDSTNVNKNKTICSWISLASTSKKGTIFKLNDYDSGGGFGLGIGSTSFDVVGNNLVGLFESARWISDANTNNIGIGWHFVCMTLDSSGVPEFYLDGSFKSRVPGSLAIVKSGAINYLIGGYNTGGRPFGGTIDEVAIWDRILSSTEIRTLYNKGNAGDSLLS